MWGAIMNRRIFLQGATAAAVMPDLAMAQQSYPQKPIQFIVPFPAGGGTDVLARVLADGLREALNGSVVVDNRAGAGGNIGMTALARAEPDGYTLGFAGASTHGINPSLYARMPFDAVRDFTPVGLFSELPLVLVVAKDFPATNFVTFLKLAREEAINYASAGNGTTSHLSAVLMNISGGTKLEHIPYRGEAPAITDILAGTVPMMFLTATTALPNIESGAMRALAVTGQQRMPALPDVPTVMESGIPTFEVRSWNALMGPPRLPGPIVDLLNTALNRAVQSEKVQSRLRQFNVQPLGGTPQELSNTIARDIAKWADVIRTANVKID